MAILIGVLLLVICFLLIITVMVQNPKGGGLSATFGGGNQILGVQKTTNFIEKTTWGMSLILLVLVLGSHVMTGTSGGNDAEDIDVNNETIEEALQNAPINPSQVLSNGAQQTQEAAEEVLPPTSTEQE